MYNNSYEELYHHGILGQKWGVRRYQNYDGSYTKAGLKRYEKSKAEYESAKNDYSSAKKDKSGIKSARKAYNESLSENKSNPNKETYDKAKTDQRALKDAKTKYKTDISDAKTRMKSAETQMNKDYKHLKQDKLGDQGKKLYAEGKTIRGSNHTTKTIAAAGGLITIGSQYLKRSGILDSDTAALISIGGSAISSAAIVKKGYDYVQAQKLRAYYGHTSNY